MSDKIIIRVESALKGLIPTFLENKKKDLDLMKEAFAKGDLETLRSLSHRMRGASSSYGFDPLSQWGEKLERASKDGDKSAIPHLLDMLTDTFARLEVHFIDNEPQSTILCVDDDEDILYLLIHWLSGAGYKVKTANHPSVALRILQDFTPDAILLDVMMPEKDGFTLAGEIQKDPRFSSTPIVFVTALNQEKDKAKALSVGGSDFLSKPVDQQRLLDSVKEQLKKKEQWESLEKNDLPAKSQEPQTDFNSFREMLHTQTSLLQEDRDLLESLSPSNLYSIQFSRFSPEQMAQYIAQFTGYPYLGDIHVEDISLGELPASFCKGNLVVPLRGDAESTKFVLSNPFQFELMDILRETAAAQGKRMEVLVTEPYRIRTLLSGDLKAFSKSIFSGRTSEKSSQQEGVLFEEIPPDGSMAEVAIRLLERAVDRRASDIHIEPKMHEVLVRFRVDGELIKMGRVPKEAGIMLVSRFKALGGLDVAEKRKPQDGSYETKVCDKIYKLRLATTSTVFGESLIIRLLEPGSKPKSLTDLGMTVSQMEHMKELATRSHGLILLVGPTGSGKSTTIYSLLSHIDCQRRSLLSVEDPVEYRIPYANQQQVDEKAGVTFEALLKSTVRQDPDILFLGEVRDSYSGKVALDFASTGHLTVTSLHTSNATTAVFRLERLGVTRGAMADTILGVLAQRLLRKLCNHCKVVRDITPQEKSWLDSLPFTQPTQVAHPVGCPHCHGTGFLGREAIYEIVMFTPEVARLVRKNRPVSEIRDYVRQRGDYLLGEHAVEKVKQHVFCLQEVYEKVLVEEAQFQGELNDSAALPAPPSLGGGPAKPLVSAPETGSPKTTVLLVDDDPDFQNLISHVLAGEGYKIVQKSDGVEAIVALSQQKFDLIVSDIDMPSMDGVKLMEILVQKGIQVPVIFVTGTADPETEEKVLDLGASDYISKPVKRNVFLMRVKKALQSPLSKSA